MNFLQKYWEKAINLGLPLPHAYDPVEKIPSFRLLSAYISFLLTICSIVYLHIIDPHSGTLAALGLWTLAMVFYLLKKLSSAKIDFAEKKFEVNSEKEIVE